jgi:UDP-glucose 4-epimerase
MARERVAVTGAGGFIGLATVAALDAAGFAVTGLVGPEASDRLRAPAGSGPWSWGEITDLASTLEVVKGCSSVVHLAGPPSVARSFADPPLFLGAHTAGTATVMQAAALAGSVRRVVIASSAEIYGVPASSVVEEDAAAAPLSPYAVAKLASEEVAGVLARSFGLETVAVRPFAVYGAGSPPWSLVGGAVSQALEAGEPAVRMNDLTRTRDFVFVDDVADLFVRAATLPLDEAHATCLPVNAATGRGTSVHELAAAALRAAGREARIEERPAAAPATKADIMAGRRPSWSDPMRLVGSPAKAARLLGWTPETDLERGLAALVAHRRRLA